MHSTKNRLSVFATMALAASFLIPFAASAAVINVPVDQPTIQAAVNAAAAGDTINVATGTYAEHVSVNKALTLNGANVGIAGNGVRGAESIVDGSDTDAAFAITANNVTINGFTVRNGSNGGLFSGIWSQTGTQNLSILNNVITQNAVGIWAQCGGNCLIEKNLFDGNNKTGPVVGGISADSTTGLTINNNEFKNHTAGNPILLQAVAPGAHTNVKVTNNSFHDNTGATVIYALAITGGTFTGNSILPASDVTGISFSGADANVTVTNNVITGTARGIRIEDAGYYGTSGGNSNIVINKNSLANDSQYGVGNISGYTGNVDATCNWWGAANGPGPVGPGSGSPVTASTTFTSWLTTSALDGPCNGVTGPATTTVHIFKYIDGIQATASSSNSVTFPMYTSTFNAPFTLGVGGWTAGDIDYEASTSAMPAGSSYSAEENLTTSLVGASCTASTTYALIGYSTGNTLAAAKLAVATTTIPNFTNMQTDKYIIVQNHLCPPVTAPQLKVHVLKYLNGQVATAVSANNYQFPMSATWSAANIGAGSGNYPLGSSFGGAANLYGADTSFMSAPADYVTSEVTDNTSQVVADVSSCAAGKYLLNGYRTSSVSFADAATAPLELLPHQFTGLTTDQYVIVDNTTCATTGVLTIEKHTIGGNGTFNFTSDIPGHTSFSLTTSNGIGSTTFSTLTPGTYHVTEASSTGWTLSENECSSVVVAAGSAPLCAITNTKNSKLGEIRGTKFEDRDGDGKLRDGDHHRLAGWTIYIDTNNNGSLDAGEATSTTDGHGGYRFLALPAGTYVVREVQKSGWIQTYPSAGSYTIVLSAGKISKKNNFGNFHLGTISGQKYNDLNGNGRKDSGEVGLAGWTINLKGPGQNGPTVSTTTNALGNYSFTGLVAGTYTLTEVIPVAVPAWHQTQHPVLVKIQSGTDFTRGVFGNTQQPLDSDGDYDNSHVGGHRNDNNRRGH